MLQRQRARSGLARISPAAACLLGGLLITTLFAPVDARAYPGIRRAFFDAYPQAIGTRLDDLPSNSRHCGVCHYDFDGAGDLNPYGLQVAGTPNRSAAEILALGGFDSDFDGHENDIEILDPAAQYENTPTFPGLSLDNVARTQNIPLDEILDHLTPESACDPCDMNCDGNINAFDIEPFLDLLFDPNAVPCDTCTGDVNNDGTIDAFDIEPFLNCLFP